MPFSTVSVEAIKVTVDSGGLFGGTAQGVVQDTGTRRPFAFTSRRRLSAAYPVIPKGDDIVDFIGAETVFNQYHENDPVITMAVNPQAIQWQQPKRIARRDTQGGVVFFHFTNQVGKDNDIVTMSFRGNTGNINWGNRTNIPGKDPKNPYYMRNRDKLLVWHNLYNLTREAILYDDPNSPGNKLENEFYILYRTPLIQTPIVLKGVFNKVLEFDETANRPNSVDYSFSFLVQDTYPNLDDLVANVMSIPQGQVP